MLIMKRLFALILMASIMIGIAGGDCGIILQVEAATTSNNGFLSWLNITDNRCDECDSKLEDCILCNGTGECDACDSSGNHICSECDGDPSCTRCQDGICSNCDGDGYAYKLSECVRCDGEGECSRCDGLGIRFSNSMYVPDRICYSCQGSGRCTSCDGKGTKRPLGDRACFYCDGSGICGTCNGTEIACDNCTAGYVECDMDGACTACSGSGKYCYDCANEKSNPITPVNSVPQPVPTPRDGDCYTCNGTGFCTACTGTGMCGNYNCIMGTVTCTG